MDTVSVWLRSHPIITGMVALAVGMVALALPPVIGGVGGECLHEVAIAAVMYAVIVAVGGAQAVRPSVKGMGFSLVRSLYPLLFAAMPITLMLLFPAAAPGGIAPRWPTLLVSALALAASVALFEEALFRGLLLSALVERIGHTRAGVMGAAVVSALVFGLMHVLPSILLGGSPRGVELASTLIKVLVTGSMGLLEAALYLRTHNLWCPTLVHAANDALLFAAVFLFGVGTGNASSAETLSEVSGVLASAGVGGSLGVLLAVGYTLVALLYAPVAIIALWALRTVDPSEGTIFSAHWEPRTPVSGARSQQGQDGPVPPWDAS